MRVILSLLFVSRIVVAQAQITPLPYVYEALGNNLVLQEKKISLEKSMIALKEARSLFLPSTWFEGQYTLADGGRTIDIPVGTLLNPVYNTLNQLTASNKFPTVENVSEKLNPNNFTDIRVRTTMPLFNPDIRINRDIKEQQIGLQANEVNIYKRELIKEVKTAYYTYLMSSRSVNIYQNALEVVSQNLRVNRSLLANGKGLPAYVTRAEAEVTKVQTQIENAVNDQKNAAAYLNFLLNRPLDAVTAPAQEEDIEETIRKNSDTLSDIGSREELKSLDLARDINGNVLKINRSFRTPRLNAFLDFGTQAFNFNFERKAFFYLGGLQVKFPIFNGKANLYKIGQSQADARALELSNTDTRNKLMLAVSTSRNNLSTSYHAYHSLVKQEESAQKYFNLIDRGYKEGVNTFIEFLDARSQLTTTQLQKNIQQYQVLIALADYERQTASYSIK